MEALQRSLRALPDRIEQLAQELADVRGAIDVLQSSNEARKAADQDSSKLREQVCKLSGSLTKRIEASEKQQISTLNAELEALDARIATKADMLDVAKMTQDVRHLQGPLLKGMETVEARVTSLELAVEEQLTKRKEERRVTESTCTDLSRRLESFKEDLDRLQAEQQRKLHELQAAINNRSDAVVLDHLNTQFRTLSTALSQKVDLAEVEQTKSQIKSLNTSLVAKAEAAVWEQLMPQCQSMCSAAQRLADHSFGGDRAADGADSAEQVRSARAWVGLDSLSAAKGAPALDQPFAACVDHMLAHLKAIESLAGQKADRSRVDDLVEQIQVLSDLVASKVVHAPSKPQGGPRRPQSSRPKSPSPPSSGRPKSARGSRPQSASRRTEPRPEPRQLQLGSSGVSAMSGAHNSSTMSTSASLKLAGSLS